MEGLYRSHVGVFFLLLLAGVGAVLLTGVKQAGAVETDTGEQVATPDSLPPLFGVQIYSKTTADAPYTDVIQDADVRWLRVSVGWEWVERQNVAPQAYRWRPVDDRMAVAADGSVEIIATLARNPEWASEHGEGPLYPGREEDLAEFMAAMVERYDGDGLDDAPGSPVVRYWELYNEPDRLPGDFRYGFGDNPDAYLRVLEAVYPRMKAASPEAQVVFGGIAYDWFDDDPYQPGPFDHAFVGDILEAGGGDYFDVMNFHVYPDFAHRWTGSTEAGPGLYEKAQALRAHMAEYGVSKPVVITEAGYATLPDDPGSEELQARYVTEFFTQAMAADIQSMIWWMLHDLDEDNPWGRYGLVGQYPDLAKRKSFYAYQTMLSLLGDANFERRLAQAETKNSQMEAYQFSQTDSSYPLYVAWLNPVDTEEGSVLHVPALLVDRHDLYGEKVRIADGDDGVEDGLVTVRVGGQPAYIKVLATADNAPGVLTTDRDSTSVLAEAGEEPATSTAYVHIANEGWRDLTYTTTVNMVDENRYSLAASASPTPTIEVIDGQGTLAPGESRQITVHFHSDRLELGEYQAEIRLEASRDTVDAEQRIPVRIQVVEEIEENYLPMLLNAGS